MTLINTHETTTSDPIVRSPQEQRDPSLLTTRDTAALVLTESGAPGPSPCTMKFTVKQDTFLTALTLVMKAVSNRSTLPVLTHILLATQLSVSKDVPDQVRMSSTNLETGISLHVDALVEQHGAFTIPATTLLSCIKTCAKGSIVTVEVQEPHILITSGRRKLLLKGGGKADEFPTVGMDKAGDEEPVCVIDSTILSHAIEEVQFVAAEQSGFLVFTGIYLHITDSQIDLIAADENRLALCSIPLPTKKNRDANMLVPVSAIRLLAKVMPPHVPVHVVWKPRRMQVLFQAGQLQVVIQLIERTFIEYSHLVPKTHKTTFTLNRNELELVLRAFKPFSNHLTLSYRSSGSVSFHAKSESLGAIDDELQTSVEGEDGSISFDRQMLIDVLLNVSAERFTFFLSGPSRPGVIIPTGDFYHCYVLACMK